VARVDFEDLHQDTRQHTRECDSIRLTSVTYADACNSSNKLLALSVFIFISEQLVKHLKIRRY
jgi:hypothetical protein